MTQEALLAFAHFAAILALVVFITSEAALCRGEWMNEKVVERLVRVDRIYAVAALAVLLTGLARTWLGVKSAAWYWHQPLLHLKLGLFIVVGLMSIKPTLMFLRWRKKLRAGGGVAPDDEIRGARRWVMVQAHVIALIPLAAVFLARRSV
jgi:putative membrane protein